MNKRLVTTVFICVVCAISAFAFTACNDGEEPSGGVEVTEDNWKAAFEKSTTAENYTCTHVYSSEFSSDEGSSTQYSETKYYFTTEGTYSDVKQIMTVGNETTTDFTGHEYYVKKGSEGYYLYTDVDGKWKLDKGNLDGVYFYFDMECGDSETATEYKSIPDLYSAFTYANGKYTATLWGEGTPATFTVSRFIKTVMLRTFLLNFQKQETEQPKSPPYLTRL